MKIHNNKIFGCFNAETIKMPVILLETTEHVRSDIAPNSRGQQVSFDYNCESDFPALHGAPKSDLNSLSEYADTYLSVLLAHVRAKPISQGRMVVLGKDAKDAPVEQPAGKAQARDCKCDQKAVQKSSVGAKKLPMGKQIDQNPLIMKGTDQSGEEQSVLCKELSAFTTEKSGDDQELIKAVQPANCHEDATSFNSGGVQTETTKENKDNALAIKPTVEETQATIPLSVCPSKAEPVVTAVAPKNGRKKNRNRNRNRNKGAAMTARNGEEEAIKLTLFSFTSASAQCPKAEVPAVTRKWKLRVKPSVSSLEEFPSMPVSASCGLGASAAKAEGEPVDTKQGDDGKQSYLSVLNRLVCTKSMSKDRMVTLEKSKTRGDTIDGKLPNSKPSVSPSHAPTWNWNQNISRMTLNTGLVKKSIIKVAVEDPGERKATVSLPE